MASATVECSVCMNQRKGNWKKVTTFCPRVTTVCCASCYTDSLVHDTIVCVVVLCSELLWYCWAI